MAIGAKQNVSFQGRFLAFWNPLDPFNGNPFGLFYFSDFLEFVDTLKNIISSPVVKYAFVMHQRQKDKHPQLLQAMKCIFK